LTLEPITGLTDEQLTELVVAVRGEIGELSSTGRPYCLGLCRSVAVVFCLRENSPDGRTGSVRGVAGHRAAQGTVLVDAVGEPVSGKRHEAHAWTASGLGERLAGIDVLADLGYVGLDLLTGTKKPAARELTDNEKHVNTELSAVRAAVERAISHLKNWKILGGRCRAPLHKYKSIVATVTALHFYKFNSPL